MIYEIYKPIYDRILPKWKLINPNHLWLLEHHTRSQCADCICLVASRLSDLNELLRGDINAMWLLKRCDSMEIAIKLMNGLENSLDLIIKQNSETGAQECDATKLKSTPKL